MALFQPILNAKRLIDCNEHPDLLAGWPAGDIVRASETAQALLYDLETDWLLAGADLDAKAWRIDAGERVITVNTGGLAPAALSRSSYFQNVTVLRTLGALRAAWQAERKTDALAMHRLDLWPLLNRVLAADQAAMTLRMAYELRAEGFEMVWRHALGEEGGDMALSYARALDEAGDEALETEGDACGLRAAFLQWFERADRVARCDAATLAAMDAQLETLTLDGRGRLGEGALKCLSIDPLGASSYLGRVAAEVAGNPLWRGIADPFNEAHFAQIMDEMGATRVGHVAMRDGRLAERLFPDLLVRA